jgi:hypothetical protein
MRTASRFVFNFWLQALLMLSGTAPALFAQAAHEPSSPRAEIAFAVVYDTSGSMRGSIPSAHGIPEAKHVIARRALTAVADRLEKFTAVSEGNTHAARSLEFGLYVFNRDQAATALPLAPFSAPRLREWLLAQKLPGDSTPLGLSLQQAGQALLASSASHKHLLVLTDGQNSTGITPQRALEFLQGQAEKKQTPLFVHVIALGIKPSVFIALQERGATLIGASDEKQLQTQLDFILENQILLEAP